MHDDYKVKQMVSTPNDLIVLTGDGRMWRRVWKANFDDSFKITKEWYEWEQVKGPYE